jgi:hypothetical protein
MFYAHFNMKDYPILHLDVNSRKGTKRLLTAMVQRCTTRYQKESLNMDSPQFTYNKIRYN